MAEIPTIKPESTDDAWDMIPEPTQSNSEPEATPAVDQQTQENLSQVALEAIKESGSNLDAPDNQAEDDLPVSGKPIEDITTSAAGSAAEQVKARPYSGDFIAPNGIVYHIKADTWEDFRDQMDALRAS